MEENLYDIVRSAEVCYFSRCECGCGWVDWVRVDDPRSPDATQAAVQAQRDAGYAVEMTTVGEVRAMPWGCAKEISLALH